MTVIADPSTAELEEALAGDADGVIRVPVLMKGRLVLAPPVASAHLRAAGADENGATRFAVDGAFVIRRPTYDPVTLAATGEQQLLLLARPDPEELVERDLGALARGLYSLPFGEVLDYVAALRDAVRDLGWIAEGVGSYAKASSPVHSSTVDLGLGMLQRMLDPDGIAEAVDRELGGAEAAGRRFLDGWVEVSAQPLSGPAARMNRRIRGDDTREASERRCLVRAMPTRQLHITAGNAIAVPLVSALRAFATKSAAVIKSPAEATAAITALAVAMHRVDPKHPLTRHTSLVYWPGGDHSFETPLMRAGAFDRVVVWGSQETVDSVRSRVEQAKTVLLQPRIGISLIARDALEARLDDSARRAVADSMAANQRACHASLVHYVEGSPEQARAYCVAVQAALRTWDEVMPHAIQAPDLARLRWLRRGPLLSGEWFENGRWPHVTSAAVYMETPFDISTHPMSRLVVVRRVDDLTEALDFAHAGVSTVGVAPERARDALRDELAARGVSNVLPLGDCERAYPGMPHDGMRVLSELVSWVSA